MGGSRGGTRGPPMKNHKNIWFLSNTGPGPLKFTKLPKLAFNFGPLLPHHRNVTYLFGSSRPLKKKEKKCKSWTPSDKNFWIRALDIAASQPMIHHHHTTFFSLKIAVFSCSFRVKYENANKIYLIKKTRNVGHFRSFWDSHFNLILVPADLFADSL